jgi:hypothetical protein
MTSTKFRTDSSSMRKRSAKVPGSLSYRSATFPWRICWGDSKKRCLAELTSRNESIWSRFLAISIIRNKDMSPAKSEKWISEQIDRISSPLLMFPHVIIDIHLELLLTRSHSIANISRKQKVSNVIHFEEPAIICIPVEFRNFNIAFQRKCNLISPQVRNFTPKLRSESDMEKFENCDLSSSFAMIRPSIRNFTCYYSTNYIFCSTRTQCISSDILRAGLWFSNAGQTIDSIQIFWSQN